MLTRNFGSWEYSCNPKPARDLHASRVLCHLFDRFPFMAAPVAQHPLEQYESLEVIGNGSFGIIRKVRRKSDGVVSVVRSGVSRLRFYTKV